MSKVLERLRDALHSHDAERMAALFAEDYASSQPVHCFQLSARERQRASRPPWPTARRRCSVFTR